ncbi:MAG: Ubiquinone/menaquinone biosynthesis C-methyltransferase UbiE [Syntrophomonadaceae bacterium]|nr:Ubiquinone/menaquinone biosynthesis C-methyltransferase UbiE [Bacillota bacterium]
MSIITDLEQRDLLSESLQRFNHHLPTALWKSIELKCVANQISKIALMPPILDLGAGEGIFSSAIFDKIEIGVDLSLDSLRYCQNLHTYRGCILADARNLPFKQGSFGSVFSNCTIEHIPELESVLLEISRVSRKGGKFILTVPTDLFDRFSFISAFLRSLGLNSLA